MITFQKPNPALVSAVSASVDAALAHAVGTDTYKDGAAILSWFLKGWVAHSDPVVQNDLALFAFAHDFEGKIVPEASAKGYLILRAAKAGLLISTLKG